MQLICEAPLAAYLAELDDVDYKHPLVQHKVQQLQETTGLSDPARAQAAFEFVRDEIHHSCDIQSSRVTCKASEVLLTGEGICEAKAHLLAALLRAQDIPAGFCYQRVVLDEEQGGYCLHCLNAVYLAESGHWIRLDARGNKPGVLAEFGVAQEKIAYTMRPELGEIDYPTIYAQPHPAMLKALHEYTNCIEMCLSGLPDAI